MKNYKKIAYLSAACLLVNSYNLFGTSGEYTTPKITLVIVVDQLSFQTVERLSPYFKYGFKKLLDHGVNFTHAHHPHGNPLTATGHTTISTGAYAKDHGVTLNRWQDEDGTMTTFGDDDAQTTAVYAKNGLYPYGLSGHHMLVETLTDQLLLTRNQQKQFFVFSLANEQMAALAMGGKLGKAIWFDDKAQQYTTSKAYYAEFPAWLSTFNRSQKQNKTWKLQYAQTSPAYQLPLIKNHRFAAIPKNVTEFTYEQTPAANDTLFNLCKTCINQSNLTEKNAHLFLWIGVSNIDILGHLYGQNSIEVIDLLYHLDQQLDDLITYAQQKVGKQKTLVVLTADHGCSPIPELMIEQGFYAARRIDATQLIQQANELIEKKYHVKNAIVNLECTHLFLNKKAFASMKPETRTFIMKTLKTFIKKHPGIKNCWTKEEMATSTFDGNNLEQYYKNQFYAKRSGDLILMPYPYCYISRHPKGTGHTSAYAYDTQVPLIFYQAGKTKKTRVNELASLTQLVPTLADMLGIPCPSEALDQSLLRFITTK